jgi:RNA polymerase sigma-70 factor (ECF subfamily)
MAAASDRELVDRARSGDAEAFGLLVRRHQKRIFRLAVHLTKSASEAEDVTQDTFVRAYQALPRFDGRSEPFTWLYRIAVNLSLNHLRQRKSRKLEQHEDDPRVAAMLSETRPGMSADPAAATDRKRLAEALCAGLDGLSETLRTTIVLVAIDGLSHEQASEVLGCPAGTVAWRVHEARRKLRLVLAESGYGTGDDES